MVCARQRRYSKPDGRDPIKTKLLAFFPWDRSDGLLGKRRCVARPARRRLANGNSQRGIAGLDVGLGRAADRCRARLVDLVPCLLLQGGAKTTILAVPSR